MDASTVLIGLGCVLATAIVFYFISFFGAKRKTYEETIEEQRRQAELAFSTSRLERSVRDKAKGRSRERFDQFGSQGEEIILGQSLESNQEVTAVSKSDSGNFTRPDYSGYQYSYTTVAQVHAEDFSQERESGQLNTLNPEDTVMKQKEDNPLTQVPSGDNALDIGSDVCAKKSKSGVSVGDVESPANLMQIVELIKSASLSQNEMQDLIDILFSKQQSGNAEWLQERGITFETNQSPNSLPQLRVLVTGLEQQLQDQKQQNQTIAERLSDVKQELSQEKTHSAHIEKEFNEKSFKQEQDFQALQNQLREMRDQHVIETSEFKDKLQQLVSNSNDSNVQTIQNLQDENARLQHAYTQSEERSYAATQVPRLQEEIEQLKTLKEQYESKQADLQQTSNAQETRIKDLEEHVVKLETSKDFAVQERTTELIRQMENVSEQLKEAVEIKQNLEARNSELQDEFTELKSQAIEISNKEISVLKETVAQLEFSQQSLMNSKTKLESEVKKLLTDLQDVKCQLHEKDIQLKVLAEEKLCFVGQISELKSTVENQTSQLKEQIPKAEEYERILTEKDSMLASITDQLKESKITTERVRSKLEDVNNKLEELQTNYSQQNIHVSNLRLEINQSSAESEQLKSDLEAQRDKNDELRQKNWKAMEALKSTEKLLEEKLQLSDKLLVETRSQVKSDQELVQRTFLERVFPLIQVSTDMPHDLYLTEFEDKVVQLGMEYEQATIFTAELAEAAQESEEHRQALEAQIEHYRTVMTETENILKKLESSVEEEEETWKSKLSAKEVELEKTQQELRVLASDKTALEQSLEQVKAAEEMQLKLQELQVKLEGEEKEKKALENKHKKEVKKLQSELEVQKKITKEIQSEMVKQTSLVKIGQDSLKAEQQLSKVLQDKLNELQSSKNSSAPPKEPNAGEAGICDPNSSANPPPPAPPSKKHKRKSKRATPAAPESQ